MLDTYMSQLQKEMNLPRSLQGEIPGIYTLPLEDDLKVSLSSIGNGIAFQCNLMKCPKGNEEELYTHALLANLFGQGTDGAVLGLSENGKLLTLSREINDPVKYKEFKEILEDFINVVDFWRQEAINPQLKK